jgi:alpha-ketoglutarate-dependent taurine dioxygenase
VISRKASGRPGRLGGDDLFLVAHAGSPDYSVSFGWKPGDFMLWDNLATWHRAVNDYDGPRAYRTPRT